MHVMNRYIVKHAYAMFQPFIVSIDVLIYKSAKCEVLE